VRLLLVEDEAAIACRTRESLEEARYTVDWARDGVEALALAREREYAAIILDLMLPSVDGWEVCETLRRRRVPTPILMLTARGALEDRIRGFEIGADDYLTKPFSPRELAARVRTVLRRASGAAQHGQLFTVGSARVDVTSRRAWAGDAEISLTSTEFDLLTHLLRHPGQVLSREQLLSAVWGYAAAAGTRTVDVHVAQLRAKLGEHSPIRTVRGVGYAADRP